MHSIEDCDIGSISKDALFGYVQNCLGVMLDERPKGVLELEVIEAAIRQLTARLAYEQSPEAAAHYLGSASRSLRRGDLFQM